MKILHLSIIVISLSFVIAGTSFVSADNETSTAYGGLVRSHQIMAPESMIQLLTGKPTYVPGEKIQIIGAFSPDDLIHVDLVNPADGTKNSTLLQSDNTGHFRTNYIVPYYAVNGTWKILATSGVNHASLDIQVISSNYGINGNITRNYGPNSLTVIKIDSPLKQFRSGIAANDVTCWQGFQLIFKAEDGSPACVTHDTAQNLLKYEWAMWTGSNKIVPISFKTCDTPYVLKTPDISPLFPNDTQITTSYIPVFFMPTNSTGNICVQYKNSNTPSPGHARIFDAQNLSKNADDVSISPSEIQVPTGTTNTTFTIQTGNAGFYGIGFFCGGLPLAVGYDASSNLVKDDFPWWNKAFYCPAMVYSSDITGTRGIRVYYIPEVTYSKIDYNVTGTSVSSVHISPTIQNITFTLNVHTFNDSADFWFDAKDSNYVKFNGDPKLEQEDSDPCTWSFTNGNAVGDEKQWYKMVGKVTVTDRPVTIPPHTNANYTFSILAKNLDAGYYGFNPVFYGRPADSTVPLENMGGGSVGSYYPVIMGLDKYLDPSGICSR